MSDIGNVKTGGFVLRQPNALIRDMHVDYKSDLDTAETQEAKPIPVPGGRSDGSGDDVKKTSQMAKPNNHGKRGRSRKRPTPRVRWEMFAMTCLRHLQDQLYQVALAI